MYHFFDNFDGIAAEYTFNLPTILAFFFAFKLYKKRILSICLYVLMNFHLLVLSLTARTFSQEFNSDSKSFIVNHQNGAKLFFEKFRYIAFQN